MSPDKVKLKVACVIQHIKSVLKYKWPIISFNGESVSYFDLWFKKNIYWNNKVSYLSISKNEWHPHCALMTT